MSVDYSYDELNRLKTVLDNRLSAGANTSTYVYSPTNTLKSLTLPNGVVTSYGYNTLDRLTSLLTTKNTTTLASYSYTLRAEGNRSKVVELGGRTVDYTYDDAYRLLSETISLGSLNGTIGYTYDAVGNRMSRTSTVTVAGISSVASYSYDANDRLSGNSYDNNGNTLTANGVTYSYDFLNRLSGASGGIAISYDGDGNRVAETVGGATTQYLVDDNNPTGYPQVVEEISGGGVQQTYTYGRELISQNQLNGGTWTPRFYGDDGLGSVRLLTDASGTKTDSYDYDAFGNLLASIGTTPNNYRFTGEQNDPNLGLYYLRARYYNTGVGRFWTRDTAAIDLNDPREINRYVYVANDPVNATDPTGLLALENAELNQNSAEEAAVAEPAGPEVATAIARNAATFERQLAQQNFNRFFGRSIMRGGQQNPVTVGQGSFVDINGVQRQFVGTNNFYSGIGPRFEHMANRMRAAYPNTEFLGGTWSRTATRETAEHFEELVVQHIQQNISQIPDKGRVVVGVANRVCAKKCLPLLRQLGGQPIGGDTIIVTLERGIKLVFVATGLG